MNNPLVSIIVPCYNQAQYLGEALESILNQTYTDWECIIVNDGSPDNTEEVAQEWVAKDARFIYLYKENGGLSSARNAGIAIAKGEFILPLDADDKISINYTELAIETFEKNTSLTLVYCKAEKFGEETGSWNLPAFSLFNLARGNMIFCSSFFRKRDWELVGGYDINMKYGSEDWEFWISILKNGGEVKRLEEVGFYYRVKLVSMVKQFKEDKTKYLHEYMSLKHTTFFITQYGSFMELNASLKKAKKQYTENLKSEKYIIDLFCSTFFKFSVFGLYKVKKQ
jgi:glycosyltransferase involved in cell wall biosynthesis